jgi:hypothetical protein
MLEPIAHEDGRTVWSCYQCGQPTEHGVGEYVPQPEHECLCVDCDNQDGLCDETTWPNPLAEHEAEFAARQQ